MSKFKNINDNEKKTGDVNTVTKELIKLKKPKLYKVILLNDDYTPMEYVVLLLKRIFNKTQDQAVNVMLTVHQKGSGVCGIYTLEVAETKVKTVLKMAKTDEHPLQCILEKE
ncbi:MAG: ATP-dependent Clp protease adapter ClpS [Rickettsiales bacterium]|nr:ATP-dependent Clp protease adapter ClpS [Rickettsiales bacterium]